MTILGVFGDAVLSVLAFILALGLIILIHEGGHFYFARKSGILCREYAFGMGPRLFKFKKGETVYSLRAFPIGGFCAIAGEDQEDNILKDIKKVKLIIENDKVKKIVVKDDDDLYPYPWLKLTGYDLFDKENTGNLFVKVIEGESEVTYNVECNAMCLYVGKVFNKNLPLSKKQKRYTEEVQIAPYNRTLKAKSKRKQAMVMFGGPLMNFVLAFVVFFLASLIIKIPTSKNIVTEPESLKINKVEYESPAEKLGLKEGSKIIKLRFVDDEGNLVTVDGKAVEKDIEKWGDITWFMTEYKNATHEGKIEVTYVKDDVEVTRSVYPFIIINSLGIMFDPLSTDLKLAEIPEKTKGYKGGLRAGDVIQKIDGVTVSGRKDAERIFRSNEAGKKMIIEVAREGETELVTCEVDPYSAKLFKKTQDVELTQVILGISPKRSFNLFKSLLVPFGEVYNSLRKVFNSLALIIGSREVGIKDLSGPVGIFMMTKTAAKGGIGELFYWIGFLSVNVGFLNLLPIPALDGGRLAFLAYEGITKKEVSPKVEENLIKITMILLLLLIIFVTINDFIRL